MNLETPYRSSAASSLDLKVIELGNMLEKLEPYGPFEKFSLEISDALKKFGYKKLHHSDIPESPNILFCINYYNLGKRLAVLMSHKARDYGNGFIGYGHDDYYAYTLEIGYIGKCDFVDEVVELSSIPRKLANILMPGILTWKDERLYNKLKKSSCKINSFRSFMALF